MRLVYPKMFGIDCHTLNYCSHNSVFVRIVLVLFCTYWISHSFHLRFPTTCIHKPFRQPSHLPQPRRAGVPMCPMSNKHKQWNLDFAFLSWFKVRRCYEISFKLRLRQIHFFIGLYVWQCPWVKIGCTFVEKRRKTWSGCHTLSWIFCMHCVAIFGNTSGSFGDKQFFANCFACTKSARIEDPFYIYYMLSECTLRRWAVDSFFK